MVVMTEGPGPAGLPELPNMVVNRRRNKDLTIARAREIVLGFEKAAGELDEIRESLIVRIMSVLTGVRERLGFDKRAFPIKFRRTDSVEAIMQLVEFSLRLIKQGGPEVKPGDQKGKNPEEVAQEFDDELVELRGRIYADFAEIMMRTGIVKDVDEVNAGDQNYAFIVGEAYKIHLRDRIGDMQVAPAYCKGLTNGNECLMDGNRIQSGEPIFYFNPAFSADPTFQIANEYVKYEPDMNVYWQHMGYTKTGQIIMRVLRRESLDRSNVVQFAG